jgi:hypothetical protein
VNSNPQVAVWDCDVSPITDVLSQCLDITYHKRSAKLIETLYLHCGVPLDHGQRPFGSDLDYAMQKVNFPTLQIVLLKCGALFTPSERPMNFMSTMISFTKTLPFLRVLLLLRDKMAKEVLDPNVLFVGSTALHEAVTCVYDRATDPDPSPRVVRLLVYEFGANPLFKDVKGRTAFDVLTATAAVVSRADFETEAAHANWQERVAATTEILRPGRDRDATVLMGQSSPASPLHLLDTETLRYIVDQTKRGDDAGDLSS